MLMGLVLGLAIYNRVLLDFPLPLPLYKKLLGQAVGLRDLEEMQPRLGRSLRQLLQYDGPASVEVGGGSGESVARGRLLHVYWWLSSVTEPVRRTFSVAFGALMGDARCGVLWCAAGHVLPHLFC